MTQALLDVRGLMKRYDEMTVLRWIDLQVQEYTITGLIGPDGAGKTTFFDCLTGSSLPDDGEIVFAGESLWGKSIEQIVRVGIARTYADARSFSGMTAIEHVMMGMHALLRSNVVSAILRTRFARREEVQAHLRAQELMRFVGLTGVEDYLVERLPQPLLRRLEIARALASRPRLLLLDEPTGGLIGEDVDAFVDLVRRLRDEAGITVIFIERNIRVVRRLAEHVVVFDYGQKIAEGPPDAVEADARVIEALLGLTPDERVAGFRQY